MRRPKVRLRADDEEDRCCAPYAAAGIFKKPEYYGRVYRIDGDGWFAGWSLYFGGALGDGGAIANTRGEARAIGVVEFLDHECGGLTVRDFVGEYAAVDDQSSGHAGRKESDFELHCLRRECGNCGGCGLHC